ncbi:MAG TPA: NAD-dependent epimerase/dehydratase family protein [Steroidobacteraceae bacterium]|nr:NAD-dependent epimerase/dehydratase family protein [Steroidobacteraceae bacterium]
MQRRSFVKYSFGALAGVACGSARTNLGWASASPKRILVLGGTRFVGPAIVEAAIAQGHTVTLFNRGVTNPNLFPYVEQLRGYRGADPKDENLTALTHRHFDVAVDVWPNDPALAVSTANILKDRVQQYLYISSIAAYDSKGFEKAGIDETAPLESWDGPARIYSRGKAESERRLHAIFGDRITIVRPGPIKGSRDTTPDLFTWLMRAQSGGTHIGPGTGADPVEFVDVKDVARFLMLAIDRDLFGTFNLAGTPSTFRQFLDACNEALGTDAKFEWIPQAFLKQHGLDTDAALKTFAGFFPHWRPPGTEPGLYQVSSAKAYRTGWQTRPFRETALDTLSFFRSQRETLEWEDYLPPEKEQSVLQAWRARSSGPRRQ